MLEGLTGIDWASLDHAYGNASDIPDFLRQLASSDEVAQQSGLGSLASRILHQGTHYSATAPAMGLLIELLREPTVSWKEELLTFLLWGADLEDPMGEEFVCYLKSRAAETEVETTPVSFPGGGQDDGYSRYPAATFDAVRAGLPLYLDFLGHDDRDVRRTAAELVKTVAAPSRELAAHLFARLTQESDLVIRVVLLFALRDARDTSLLPYLVDELLLDPHLPVPLRWATAVVIAHWAEEACHPDALALLSAALLEPEFRLRDLSVPLGHLNPYGEALGVEWNLIIRESCRALERVRREDSLPVFLAAASTLPEETFRDWMISLHRRFFGKAQVSEDPADWLEDQIEILRCLANTDRLHRYYALPQYLAGWGLPLYQTQLQRFLQRLETGTPPLPQYG